MWSRDGIQENEHAIDILIVDPIVSDAKRTATCFRLALPQLSIVRVLHADQALRLMRDRGLYTASPQLPATIVVELAALSNGKDLLKSIHADSSTRDIPLIVFSIKGHAKDIEEAYSLGATTYIVKPADALGYQAEVERMASMFSRRSDVPARLRA